MSAQDDYPCPHEVEVLEAHTKLNYCDSDCDNCIPQLKSQIEGLTERADALTKEVETLRELHDHEVALEPGAKIVELKAKVKEYRAAVHDMSAIKSRLVIHNRRLTTALDELKELGTPKHQDVGGKGVGWFRNFHKEVMTLINKALKQDKPDKPLKCGSCGEPGGAYYGYFSKPIVFCPKCRPKGR